MPVALKLGDTTMMGQKLFQDFFHTHVESPPSSRSALSIRILQVAKEHSEKMVREAERKYMDRRRYLKENLHFKSDPSDKQGRVSTLSGVVPRAAKRRDEPPQ